MAFQKLLNEALINLQRYKIPEDTDMWRKEVSAITISESTKIRCAGTLLNEVKASKVVAILARMAKTEQRGLQTADLQRVLEALLRSEGHGDPAAVAQEVQELMGNAGVVQSIQHELKKMGIGLY